MKSVFLIPTIVTTAAVVLFACNKQTEVNSPSSDELMNIMLSQAKITETEYLPYCGALTKSGESMLENFESPDEGAIDADLLRVIDFYISDDGADLNESAVITMIAGDESLSYDEKVLIAQTIGSSYCVKNQYAANFDTKSTPDECLSEYKKACKRAIRDYAIACLVGGCTPGAVIAATVVAVFELMDAQDDYDDCMASAQ